MSSVRSVARLTRAVSPRSRTYITTNYPKINSSRLWTSIHETAQWGAANSYGSSALETGVSRLALSALDSSVRSWLQSQSTSLSLSTQVDQMGNQFLTRAGTQPSLRPIAMGSHLDTQPAGGRFDGILGVLAALEVLRTLEENGVVTQHPLTLVNWTNEEGARFPKSMLSSGVWAGAIPLETAWGLKEVVGEKTVRQELETHGWLGPVPASHEATPLAAYFELHIEQGPILERGGRKVGVVKGVQAYRWYSVEIVGREAHTGATPEENRADALLAASRCYIGCKEIAKKRGGMASVGIMKVGPGSTNTVPGNVRFSLDVRAPKFAQVLGIENDCKALFEEVCREGGGCKVEWTQDFESRGTLFNENCRRAVEKAAVDVVGEDKIKEIISGAGHDSVYTSERCPTGMIFVPCRGGVSHNPTEWSSEEDCAIGAQVLLGAVLEYDGMASAAQANGEPHGFLNM